MNRERFEILMQLLKENRWQVDVEAGTVRSKLGDKHCKSFKGYYLVGVNYQGKFYVFKLHQIIMAAAGVDLTNLTVDHINGNKEDNRIANLEAVTMLENIRRAVINGLNGPEHKARGSKHGMTHLTERDVYQIKHQLICGVPQRKIAECFHVAQSRISDINTGKTWKHVTSQAHHSHKLEVN